MYVSQFIVRSFFLFQIGLLVVGFNGCTTQREATTEEVPPSPPLPLVKKEPVPEIFIRLASLDVSGLQRKIDQRDIRAITDALAAQKIEVLTIQGITRYPELKSRIDLVDELAAASGMRKAFGENITLSGRQTGNAVFSAYPIVSHATTGFESLASGNFESALQAVIDVGVREVVVISSRLPDQLSDKDVQQCLSMIGTMYNEYAGFPILMTGNLPAHRSGLSRVAFRDAGSPDQQGGTRVWYAENGTLKNGEVRSMMTPLGPMLIGEFGIFRNGTGK